VEADLAELDFFDVDLELLLPLAERRTLEVAFARELPLLRPLRLLRLDLAAIVLSPFVLYRAMSTAPRQDAKKLGTLGTILQSR
jgi:hypothetical protein